MTLYQETFEDYLARQPIFHGSDIDMNRDAGRLKGQIQDVYNLMKDGKWRSLGDIASATGHGEASISAQLRNLRKVEFGSHVVEKVHVRRGLFEYRLNLDPVKAP